MPELSHRTSSDLKVPINADELTVLRTALTGTAVIAGEPGYDEACTIWNAMIERRPGLVVRAANVADVVSAIHLARERELLLSVRGGGHNIAGNALCEGGLMLDLSEMNDVVIDAAARTARVGPGATLAQFDAAAQVHGLATPLGINSTTGVAGLTLGGGFGWLTRKHGLTVDNLISVDIVTAGGEQLTASAAENVDLFWGVRGGGGNFGVVTAFEYRLQAIGPTIVGGMVVHPFPAARDVLRFYGALLGSAPDALTVAAAIVTGPDGHKACALACAHAGKGAAKNVAIFSAAAGSNWPAFADE